MLGGADLAFPGPNIPKFIHILQIKVHTHANYNQSRILVSDFQHVRKIGNTCNSCQCLLIDEHQRQLNSRPPPECSIARNINST